MHGIEKITQMDIFYHAMNYTLKGTLDVTSGGAFRRKDVEEATQLIKELAKSNYRAPSEALGSSSKLKGGIIELTKMSAIEAKLDALMNKMNTQDKIGYSYNELELVESIGQKCAAEEGLAHEGPYQVEEAQFVSRNRSYNFKLNNNLPTHYTPALRNHENFS